MRSPSFSAPPRAASHQAQAKVFSQLLPIALAVFVGFLTTGLGMGMLVVGVFIGAQFAAALLSPAWAGALVDTRGARRAVIAGLVLAACSGLACLASLAFVATPATSFGVLLLGCLLLGCAESLVVTGAPGWDVGLVGPHNAGKVMAWVGVAMYGAYAAGAPAGGALQAQWGFGGIAAATVLTPLLANASWGVQHA